MAFLRSSRFWLFIMIVMLSAWVYRVHGQAYNGFFIADPLIPISEIHQGGPPRDGIPAIDSPQFDTARDTHWLSDDALVLTLDWNGAQRAYPLAIMNWHEVVNDSVGGQAIIVTYCPLCGSGMAFLPNVAGRELSFGVSGLLYNSDVLLYDRQTESLWSQLKSQAISGPLKGSVLQLIPLDLSTWGEWRERYPLGQVLSRNTGAKRDYSRNLYARYQQEAGLIFPVAFASRRYHPKERVLGVTIEGKSKAYPFAELAKGQEDVLLDQFQGLMLRIRYNAQARTGAITTLRGEAVPSVNAFWFAWYAFNPDTEVFTAPKPQKTRNRLR